MKVLSQGHDAKKEEIKNHFPSINDEKDQRLFGLNCIGERALIKAAAQPTQRLIL
jgi:hypothetical protein